MFNKTYMKKNFFICVMMLMTLGSGVAFAADVADYNVVPLPQKVTLLERGSFELTKDVVVAYPQGDEAMKQNAQFLIDYLKDVTGIELASTTDKVKGAAIRLVLDKKVVGDEAYTLTVDGKRGVTIAASTPCGVFYGIQTLRKSLLTPLLLCGLRKEVHRPDCHAQYEPFPLAPDRRPGLAHRDKEIS